MKVVDDESLVKEKSIPNEKSNSNNVSNLVKLSFSNNGKNLIIENQEKEKEEEEEENNNSEMSHSNKKQNEIKINNYLRDNANNSCNSLLNQSKGKKIVGLSQHEDEEDFLKANSSRTNTDLKSQISLKHMQKDIYNRSESSKLSTGSFKQKNQMKNLIYEQNEELSNPIEKTSFMDDQVENELYQHNLQKNQIFESKKICDSTEPFIDQEMNDYKLKSVSQKKFNDEENEKAENSNFKNHEGIFKKEESEDQEELAQEKSKLEENNELQKEMEDKNKNQYEDDVGDDDEDDEDDDLGITSEPHAMDVSVLTEQLGMFDHDEAPQELSDYSDDEEYDDEDEDDDDDEENKMW